MPFKPLEPRHRQVLEEGPILTRGVLVRNVSLEMWIVRLGESETVFGAVYLDALEKICANPKAKMGFKVEFEVIVACGVGDSAKRKFTKFVDLDTGKIMNISKPGRWDGNTAFGGKRHKISECEGPEREMVNKTAGDLLERLRDVVGKAICTGQGQMRIDEIKL
jgi:hypothetical protein